jgi:hypothetical protein
MVRQGFILGLLLAIPGVCGCQEVLFTDRQPRSPYERYLTLRGNARPAMETDAFGIERPALRQRLRPLDQP